MLNYFAELVGTFIFISVILIAVDSATKWAFLPIGLALSVMIYWGGSISGGHYNPAVSTVFLLKKNINMTTYLIYVACQILGGMCALLFFEKYKSFTKK